MRGSLTDDRGQDPENQLRQLRDWCARMGHPIVREYVEYENGLKGAEYRKQLAAMFTGAARREFDLAVNLSSTDHQKCSPPQYGKGGRAPYCMQ